MSRMKDPSEIKGNHLSQETKEEMARKKREMASKSDRILIENMKEYPKILKNIRGGETKESKQLKKELRMKFDNYRTVLMNQEEYPGQYVSDNDFDKLAKIVMLEDRE